MTSIKAFTNYPVDNDHKVKEVQVLSYDRNKYCDVVWGDQTFEVKAGYLFKDEEMQDYFKRKDLLKLPNSIDSAVPTKRQIQIERKQWYKKSTTYKLSWTKSDGTSGSLKFGSIQKALKTVKDLSANLQAWSIYKTSGSNKESVGCALMSYRGDELIQYPNRRNKCMSVKTLKRHGMKGLN